MIPTIGLPAEAERIAEIIADYDPELELRWIPPQTRTAFDDKPFSVWHVPADGREPYMIMSIAQNEMDHRVIAALFKANLNENDVLGQLEADENAQRVMQAKDRLDAQQEQAEFAKWAIKSTKTVKHNGRTYE